MLSALKCTYIPALSNNVKYVNIAVNACCRVSFSFCLYLVIRPPCIPLTFLSYFVFDCLFLYANAEYLCYVMLNASLFYNGNKYIIIRITLTPVKLSTYIMKFTIFKFVILRAFYSLCLVLFRISKDLWFYIIIFVTMTKMAKVTWSRFLYQYLPHVTRVFTLMTNSLHSLTYKYING